MQFNQSILGELVATPIGIYQKITLFERLHNIRNYVCWLALLPFTYFPDSKSAVRALARAGRA